MHTFLCTFDDVKACGFALILRHSVSLQREKDDEFAVDAFLLFFMFILMNGDILSNVWLKHHMSLSLLDPHWKIFS